MGYYIDQLDSDIFIERKNFGNVGIAIANKYNDDIETDPKKFSKDDFISAMRKIRFTPYFDTNGNMDKMYFDGEKYWDIDSDLEAIAPFVSTGRSIR